MSAKRDHHNLFPSASIGRTQGAAIARTPSRESLAVHPLLTTPDSAKYVPYTPRQRPATLPPPTPPQPTAKPNLANLRAAAQSTGLEPHSVGWAILDKISYEGDSSDDWSEIWNALTKGKAALLLPTEPSAGHDSITPEFVQDHLVLCDLASTDDTAVVTLSGLRGHIVHNTLTFRSTLHRSSKQFQSLWATLGSRAASLDALPPLPLYPPESSYPSYSISAFSAALPLPSRATKPQLPPRPGTVRGTSTPAPARLAMPFASLFGQRPSTPPPPPPPTTTAATALPSSDVDSIIDISAFVIDTALSRTDVATGIINALKGEIAIALNEYPPWVVERVHAFSVPYLPFVKVPAGKKKLQDIGGNPNRVTYAVHHALDQPEDLADKFQAFYRAVEGELRNGNGPDASVQRDPELADEKIEVDEARIRDVLETIESTLCTLLYDRLFLPSTSDDASHNEALSSRIAALNMLDLGLEHLDIALGDATDAEVDTVVHTCGQALAQLDISARSPREKAAVLVSSHKLVVEGLSKIPPVRLKSHDDKLDVREHPSQTNDTTSPVVASDDQPPSEPVNPSPLVPIIHLSTSPEQPSTLIEPEPASTSSPVSGDVLLPILIFSVVKANPSRLVSHLLFTQRFRNQSFGGEESYCLINLMAVAEFLENVDLNALGLGESAKKVLSTADLTPIPIARPLPESPIATTLSGEEHLASLRGRVGQGVDAIAGSANKVILGVVDSSFGVLRALLPGPGQTTTTTSGAGGGVPAAATALSGAPGPSGAGTGTGAVATEPGAGTGVGAGAGATGGETDLWGVRPSLGLLRRETGFSIAGLTAAFPAAKAKTSHSVEDGQRELVEVSSRPASLRSRKSTHAGSGSEASEEEDEEEEEEQEGQGGGEHGLDGVEEEEVSGAEEDGGTHDARSIKSFESMLSSGRVRRKSATTTTTTTSESVSTSAPGPTTRRRRKRLSDLTGRLTHGMAEMSRRVQGGDGQHTRQVLTGRFPAPNRRFVECTEQDILVGEVGELLREYQRLVEAVRSAGGFQE